MRIFNIIETYIDEDYPWSSVLAAVSFLILLTTNSLKVYSPVQLVFIHDIILPIKHKLGWGLIRQQNHMQIKKDHVYAKIDIKLTPTTRSYKKLCSIIILYKNVKRHIRVQL